MKTTIIAVALVQSAAAVANPPGWDNGNWGNGNWGPGGFNGGGWGGWGAWGNNGAAKCAASCFSSHFQTATPTPQAFCTDNSQLNDCVRSACPTETAAIASWSSASSSACSAFNACSSKSTFTYSGGWWGDATKTDAAVTVTGCPVDGWWIPGGPLGGMPAGWKYQTNTFTVTRTVTNNGQAAVTTGPVTVAEAYSGTSTIRSTLTGVFAAQQTDSTTTNAAAGVDRSVKVAGVCLGAAVAVVGLM
ncbi:uncharacterized protein CTRU02_207422 [Colletotrichum truncatum]|uniref:Uncharacterized protein n=1 Tax=Colletotrichum truncatum TaxID=5467 RepID=A0ACC3Z0R8_COLTU|nr:uncharacterized protein CTRU02_00946 [Colletotrichum truncatum]KAF6800541.1 hypothetical protein CTRU02_00946 [Colletotrichum truncatum]